MSDQCGTPDSFDEWLDLQSNTRQRSDFLQSQTELPSNQMVFDPNAVLTTDTRRSILDEYITIPSGESSSSRGTTSDLISHFNDNFHFDQSWEDLFSAVPEPSPDNNTVPLQQETYTLTNFPTDLTTAQNSNMIKMLVQPEPFHEPNYLSRQDTGFLHNIQGVQRIVNKEQYNFPAVTLAPKCLEPNQNLFIRITAVTVDHNYIHPYTLQIRDDNTNDIFCKDKSVFFRVLPNQTVDSNHAITFKKLVLIKLTRCELRNYGNLYSFGTNQECPNTKKKPKEMIEQYDLEKTKLAFSILQLDSVNQDFHPPIDIVFSDVMEEKKNSKKTSDTTPKATMRPQARKRARPNANDTLPTSESDSEEDVNGRRYILSSFSQKQGKNLQSPPVKELLDMMRAVDLTVASFCEGDWKRVFDDDFNQNDGREDLSKWIFEEGTSDNGWGTHQKQYYTRSGEKNTRLENGHLVIEARKDSYKSSSYTSARLRSKQAFRYGRLQFRAKFPSGKGMWSCICLLPEKQTYGDAWWPDNGEMNISHLGYQPSKVASSVATLFHNAMWNNLPWNALEVADATTQFHVYTLLWTPHEIKMFVGPDEARALERRIFIRVKDGKSWKGWPFDRPFQIVIYLAVGGEVAGVEGIDDEKFPQQMEIDWIHFDQQM